MQLLFSFYDVFVNVAAIYTYLYFRLHYLHPDEDSELKRVEVLSQIDIEEDGMYDGMYTCYINP